MSSKLDELLARAQAQQNKKKQETENSKEMPDYEKDYGHKAEDVVIFALKNEGNFVEEIEKGTKTDDLRKKVDIWVKFYLIAEPLGIQLTISDNEDKIQDKKDVLEKRGWKAKKEKTEGSKIDWVGNVNVIMVRLNKKEVAEYEKKNNEKETSDSINKEMSEFVGKIYRQIFKELERINPLRRDIYYKVFKEEFENGLNKKG